ncbi:MAG: VWA domain-containing protein [Myxococcales bacterium]|nr:VWA domain-containing protein [Myxococcales bacterium]
MRWGHGEWWWLIALPIGAVALFIFGHLMRQHLLARAGHLPLVRQLLATFSPERRIFKQLLIGLSLALVTIAALRPQYGRRPETLRQTGIDIAIVFDISKSMLARDVQPSRIQAARDQLARLLGRLTGDRVALVPFAGVAFTQSPLTADQGAIKLYLDSLDPMQMPVGGTNLAMAIKQGTTLLTGEEDRGERSSRSRVLLLITDGEDVAADQGEAAKAAAKAAGEAGVRIYAVAIGTRLGEPIPLINADGTHAGYQKDSSGKPIYSKLNLPLLEELARAADPERPDATRVFHFDGSRQVADALATELDTMQKDALEGAMRQKYGEKFQYALLPAILLLLIELFIGERRRRRREEEA